MTDFPPEHSAEPEVMQRDPDDSPTQASEVLGETGPADAVQGIEVEDQRDELEREPTQPDR